MCAGWIVTWLDLLLGLERLRARWAEHCSLCDRMSKWNHKSLTLVSFASTCHKRVNISIVFSVYKDISSIVLTKQESYSREKTRRGKHSARERKRRGREEAFFCKCTVMTDSMMSRFFFIIAPGRDELCEESLPNAEKSILTPSKESRKQQK